MPSIRRPLSDDVMIFRLPEEREHAADPATILTHGRSARTLLKDGAHDIAAGEMLSAGAGLPHSVQSMEGAAFLLTVTSDSDDESGSDRGGSKHAKPDG